MAGATDTRLWVALGVVAAVGVAAFVDLKVEVAELRGRVAVEGPAAVPSEGAPNAPQPTAAAPPALPTSPNDQAPAGPLGSPSPGHPPKTVTTPTSSPPDWQCTGTIDAQAVRSAVGRQGRPVFACYEARHGQAPHLEGDLLLRMRVGADGHVTDVNVTGLDDAPLRTCVGHAALTWQFPLPSGGDCAVVEAPFGFHPPAP